ncbi:MAG TPA: peptide deformylase [Chitinivibrionales bacterium]
MLRMHYYGHPILRKKAAPVTVFDDDLKAFVNEMKATMREYEGVGLAAPQVGWSIRCVVIDPSKEANNPIVFINPEFTYKSEETMVHEEGCLSFPDLHVDISRHKIVSVKAFDENGKSFIVENAEDLFSRALQHEIDHIDGLFIIDHISLLQRKLLKGKLKKISEMNFSETALSDASA